MMCPVCLIGNAIIDPTLGVLPCVSCRERRRKFVKPSRQVEFTTESIQQQRKEHRTDILPSHNRGQLDKGFVDRYGIEKTKAHGYSDKEIQEATYVYSGVDEYYKSEL